MNDWIILRLRPRAGAGLLLAYEDDDGYTWPAEAGTSTSQDVPIGSRMVAVEFLLDLGTRIRRNLIELRTSIGWSAPIPLPLFVTRAETLDWQAAEGIVRFILQGEGIAAADIQIVRLARDGAAERKAALSVADALSLPLVIGWEGKEAGGSLQTLQGREWITEEVAKDGLRIVELVTEEISAPHIVVSSLPQLSPTSARLVIWLPGDRREAAVPARAAGQSLLLVGPTETEPANRFLKELIYGVIHDQPLHAALSAAHGQVAVVFASLYSTPAANQALRLSATFVSLFEKAKRLDDRLSFNPRAIRYFLPENDFWLEEGFRSALPRRGGIVRPPPAAAFGLPALQKEVRTLTKNVDADFNRESGGLVPMAETARQLGEKEARVASIESWLTNAGEEEEHRAVLHPREERLFDVALMRREVRDSDSLFVDTKTAIMALRRYVVRVQIGRPLAQSIVVKQGPDVDSQLPPPPPGGHLLTVVLYPFDFDCKSPTMQSFRLPERGPSEPVYFEVVAPSSHGRAEMRVALYYELPPGAPDTETHRNHLLQSFLIESEVMQYEMGQPSEVTVARLEVARRPQFDALSSLGRRIASLGLNASPLRPDEHRFTLKGTDVGSWVSIPEQTIQSAIDDIRKLFRESTRRADGDDPRFPKEFAPSERAARQADFESVIRTMATAGSDLYWRVWRDRPGASTEENTKHQQALLDIRERSDETIQIMRYDLNYVFPWALLYDFPLPANPATAPVCDGFLRTVEGRPIGCAECLKECHHGENDDAICVWGFWGLRHEVEQLLHGEAASVANVIEPLRDGGVLLSVGIASSEYLDAAVTTLEGSLGKAVRKLGDLEEPAEILWSDGGRPAIAVFLGHHDAAEGGDWHLSLPGTERWLENRALKNRLQKRAGAYWGDPHSVILLAACGTAPTDLKKLSTFVDTFAQAKASAVIGTEVVVFEGLAADLATSLVTSMLREGAERATLGKAVLDFRRQLLQQLSPLGFVVTPYGDADIRLAAKGDA